MERGHHKTTSQHAPNYIHLGLGSNNYEQPTQDKNKDNKESSRKTTFKLHAYKNLHGNKYLRTEPDEAHHHKILTTAANTKAPTIGMLKYEIDGTAGKGTFGVVYEGHVKGTG